MDVRNTARVSSPAQEEIVKAWPSSSNCRGKRRSTKRTCSDKKVAYEGDRVEPYGRSMSGAGKFIQEGDGPQKGTV